MRINIHDKAKKRRGRHRDEKGRGTWHTSNRSNVDDVSLAAIWSFLENWQDGLCHVDETGDVCRKDNVHVFFINFRCFSHALDKPTERI